MSDAIAAATQALLDAKPQEAQPRTSSMDPTAVDASRTNKKGVPYAPNAARGHVVALGQDEDGNWYFAVPAYEVIRLNPEYQRDNERMHDLVAAASDGGLYDVATRMGRAIPGYPDFRPKFVAEIRKAPEADEAGE